MMQSARVGALIVLSSLTALLSIQCGPDKKSALSPADTMPSAEPPLEDTDGGATTAAPSLSDSAAAKGQTDTAPPAPSTRAAKPSTRP